MAAIGMMVGGAIVNALAFTGGNYLFSLLGGKSAEAEKERKRHDLAIEELQHAQANYQHSRQLRLDYLNQQLWAEQQSSCLLYTSPSPRDRQKSRMPSSA